MRYRNHLVALAIFATLAACQSHEGPPGKILIRNDILDKEYNVVVVDNVSTRSGPVSFRARLKPTEKIVLPFKKVTAMRFSRAYKDVTRVYEVNCPGEEGEGFTVKLIDVHTGRLHGGCTLARKGERPHGGDIEWE